MILPIAAPPACPVCGEPHSTCGNGEGHGVGIRFASEIPMSGIKAQERILRKRGDASGIHELAYAKGDEITLADAQALGLLDGQKKRRPAEGDKLRPEPAEDKTKETTTRRPRRRRERA
jgi:hypothetical protein